MSPRPEPFLAERVWAHPTNLETGEGPVTVELDDAGRPRIARYADGGTETYTYDAAGTVIEIDEYEGLWFTAEGAQRLDTGGRLRLQHDARGLLRIDASDHLVWERTELPWPERLEHGAAAIADRCVETVVAAGADPGTEAYCLMLTYVHDGGLHTMVSVGTEEDRRAALADDDPHAIACGLWYPESNGLAFLEVEDEDDDGLDVLLREAALNDPREAQRTVLTEVAKLLARRDWSGILVPTEDFVVYIAEHDEGFAEKHESVREVNPRERLAAWDARWPAGVPRDDRF